MIEINGSQFTFEDIADALIEHNAEYAIIEALLHRKVFNRRGALLLIEMLARQQRCSWVFDLPEHLRPETAYLDEWPKTAFRDDLKYLKSTGRK